MNSPLGGQNYLFQSTFSVFKCRQLTESIFKSDPKRPLLPHKCVTVLGNILGQRQTHSSIYFKSCSSAFYAGHLILHC